MPDNEDIKNEKRAAIAEYIKALKGILCLRKFVIEKLNGEFYFGSKLTYKNGTNRPQQTPDIIVKLSDSVWVGEVKRGLTNLKTFGSEEEYLKKYIENQLVAQLKRYDEPFQELRTDTHDIVLLAPYRDYESIGYLKLKYLKPKLQAGKRVFNNNFAIVVYSIDPGANNTEFILIRLDDGELSNHNAKDLLQIGYSKMLGEIKDDLGKFKVYEEPDKTPIEYIMTLLWTEILPEVMKKSDVNQIITWRNRQENVFEFKLSELVGYLHSMYTLPSLNSNDHKQFESRILKDALAKFSSIKFWNERTEEYIPAIAQLNSTGDPEYRITYRAMPEKDELSYILDVLYREGTKRLPEVPANHPKLGDFPKAAK